VECLISSGLETTLNVCYRYRDMGDDECMESSFSQQLKEEYVSTKMGILEDLEDMEMEKREVARKKKMMMMKKKRRL
jgi:protein SPT2